LVKSQRSSELSTRAATQRREERNSRIEDWAIRVAERTTITVSQLHSHIRSCTRDLCVHQSCPSPEMNPIIPLTTPYSSHHSGSKAYPASVLAPLDQRGDTGPIFPTNGPSITVSRYCEWTLNCCMRTKRLVTCHSLRASLFEKHRPLSFLDGTGS
jgi:hypothetical protein